MEDTQRIDEIPTKEFSARIFANMTDVCTLAYSSILFA